MKLFTIACCLIVLVVCGAGASMRCEPIDLEKRTVRLIYEIEDTMEGNRVFIFPQGGLIHDATRGEIDVESVFDVTAKQELDYEITRTAKTGQPQVKITYAKPLAAGQKRVLQISVIVRLPESQLRFDGQERYTFAYETSHAFEFIVPTGHYVVYSNQPVFLFEKGPNIILQQLDENLRNIVIQIRPLPE